MRLPGKSRIEIEKLKEKEGDIRRQLRELYSQYQNLKTQEAAKKRNRCGRSGNRNWM